jgi:hypothetical protein
VVARPSRKLAIAHGPQLPAQGLLGNGDAEFLVDPLRQIDQPPAHHAVDGRNGTILDHPRNGLALDVVEPGGLSGRFAVPQTIGATRIEPHHPVPDDLKPYATDLCRRAARRTIIDRRKSQKPPDLRAVFRLLRQAAKLRGIKVPAQWYRNRHREPRSFAMLNQMPADLGIPTSHDFKDLV